MLLCEFLAFAVSGVWIKITQFPTRKWPSLISYPGRSCWRLEAGTSRFRPACSRASPSPVLQRVSTDERRARAMVIGRRHGWEVEVDTLQKSHCFPMFLAMDSVGFPRGLPSTDSGNLGSRSLVLIYIVFIGVPVLLLSCKSVMVKVGYIVIHTITVHTWILSVIQAKFLSDTGEKRLSWEASVLQFLVLWCHLVTDRGRWLFFQENYLKDSWHMLGSTWLNKWT